MFGKRSWISDSVCAKISQETVTHYAGRFTNSSRGVSYRTGKNDQHLLERRLLYVRLDLHCCSCVSVVRKLRTSVNNKNIAINRNIVREQFDQLFDEYAPLN